jgi:DNA repair exonuclease SbcCD nuclease subunit
MKMIFFADPHIHPFQQHSRILPGGVNSRLQAGIDVLKQICDYAMGQDIHYLVCAGDLFHWKEKLDVQALNMVLDLLGDYPLLQFYFIPGNHDMASHDGSVHSLSPLSLRNNAVVISEPVGINLGGAYFVFVPYIQTNGKFDKVLFADAVQKEWPREPCKSVLVSHCYIDDLMQKHFGIAGNVEASDLASLFDLSLLGHLHIHDTVSFPNGRCVVSIGAPIQQRVSDAGNETGFLVLETDKLSLQRVRTHGPEFASVPIGSLDPEKVADNFVRVRVSSKQEEEKVRKELEKMGAASVAVEVVPVANGSRIDISPGSKDADLFQKYLSSPWGETKLDHARLTEMALRYLEGQL